MNEDSIDHARETGRDSDELNTVTESQFYNVRIHVYKEDGSYIAHCLDFDFATQGSTFPDVLRSLAHCIETQVELSKQDGIVPFSDFEPAPHKCWQRAGCHETQWTGFAIQTLQTGIQTAQVDYRSAVCRLFR